MLVCFSMKKHIFIFVCIFSCFLQAPLFAESEGRLTQTNGKVYIRPKSLPANEWIAAEPNMPLEEGDTIRTDTGGSAEISLDGDTVIHLGENTELKADTFQSQIKRFFMSLGSLSAKIRKMRQAQEQFHIKTPLAVAAVRGTELAVTYEGEDQPAVIGVFDEGQVVVETEGNEEVVLNPGQETEIAKDSRPIAPRPLEKLQVNRPQIVSVRERAQFLHARWESIPPAKRHEFRSRMLAKPRTQHEFKRPPAHRPEPIKRKTWRERREERREERKLKQR